MIDGPRRTRSYLELIEELSRNRDAWQKLDLRVSRSRFDGYERALCNAQKVAENPSLVASLLPKEVNYFFQMIPDIYEFNDVSDALLDSNSLDLRDRARKIFSGPDMQIDEKDGSSGASRNTLFELLVAAFLKHAALPLDLTGITDVVTEFEGRKMVVEAKRPLSRTGVKRCVRDARSQLERRFAQGKGEDIGVIALSCSRIYTGGTMVAHDLPSHVVQQRLIKFHGDLVTESLREWQNSPAVDLVLLYSAVAGSMERPELHAWVTSVVNGSSTPATFERVRRFYQLFQSSLVNLARSRPTP